MAFSASQLRAISEGSALGTAPGNVNQVYFYRTNDTAAVVEANAYFDGALNNGLKAGDVIFCLLDEDGTPVFKIYHVTVGGADVTIKSMTQVARLTDSSGGTAGDTIAAIGATYDQAEVRNAVASLAAKINNIMNAIGIAA